MLTLRQQVAEFHLVINQPIRLDPVIPSDAEVRLRARLIAEEFFETMLAMFPLEACLVDAQEVVMECINGVPSVNLPELADALGDLDYVVEGTRLVFGIDGEPIAAAIHKANLAKRGGPVDAHGKQRKPEGWKPAGHRGRAEGAGLD